MIQSLSNKYKKHIAWPFFVIFYMQILSPLAVAAYGYPLTGRSYNSPAFFKTKGKENYNNHPGSNSINAKKLIAATRGGNAFLNNAAVLLSPEKQNIGGPSSPEASAFKAVGSDNLVNLSTGDFSYSIPLLDVGGYPVNLFYSGGVTMEQEASWVGLGWNINPGTVNRNMRGVPDDFNGKDTLIQSQNVKPNRTWGGEIGADFELMGLKKPAITLGKSMGFSYNNYLGPALEMGNRVSLALNMPLNVLGDKSAPSSLGFTAALDAKLSSRSGLTFTPSLNANTMLLERHMGIGVGLSTAYNSRTGIRELNIHSEMGYYQHERNFKDLTGHQSATTPSLSESIASTTISFARPSYLPSLRMPMQNTNTTGQVEVGVGTFSGVKIGVSAMGYYSESIVPDESKVIYKPLVGYMYSENAVNNKNAVMDFNRLGDGEVTPNTPIISAPQYDYDIFSIQGEGTGGSIRAYRGDLGFVRDNETTSKEKSISFGADIAPGSHYGANVNIIKTPTRVGGWEDANNKLNQAMPFRSKSTTNSFENIYFKNPGEGTVTSEEIINRIGRDNLVRFQLGGTKVTPTIEPSLEQFDKYTNATKAVLPVVSGLQNRDKRTQVITMLTAADARKIGLDTTIKNYTGTFDDNKNIVAQSIARVGDFRKPHHISEIDVLEQSGMRYVYGLPVYSLKQKDFTFSVNAVPANAADNLVGYSATEPTINSEHMANKAKLDGYVQTQETPAYAASFLLTGLLSPDYVDVTGDGITEDDLGNAVKFNYQKSDGVHKWRTPRNNSTANLAHFNEGIRTEKKDNKATITYGEREVWYLNSIESKSMVAIFTTEWRDDAKGVVSDLNGKVNTAENANKRLKKIDLYTKAELKAKGLPNAVPLKTVNFMYSYKLCKGTPDNASNSLSNTAGKLTLDSVYFTYNGKGRAKKEKYVFNYGAGQRNNPGYSYNASDRWGTYKPVYDSLGVANNPAGLTNIDYPYTLNDKSKSDIYAGAWSLKKILLPSGGQMEVQYEADDYGYVQNRRACNMVAIAGLGLTTDYVAGANNMYGGLFGTADNNYVYINLPQPLVSTTPAQQKQEMYTKYLEGVNQLNGKNQLVFKLQVGMPNGLEPLTIYPEYDDYGVCTNDSHYMYVHLKPVDGKSPLVNSALGFLTENIPGQAFPGYDIEADGLQAYLDMVGAMISNLSNAFTNVNGQMRAASKGRDIALASSFIRLANPVKIKFGGGVRVKSIRVKDNWDRMTGKYNSEYGQDYDYTTTEKINGTAAVISSGVASYEPGIGSEENPFREIVSFSNKMPLASAQYGAIEMPMLEGLYPSPNVVYSKVTVRSIHRKGTHGDSSLRSAIGKQVTEFFTARDYPTYSANTAMNTIDYKKNPFFSLFYKEIINRRTISQGFLVETNDMHGRIKSQLSYSESDEKTPLTATYHTYKNTGKNGLNDQVDFVYGSRQGLVSSGNMGIDMELMTDVREFSVQSNGYNGQGQVDLITTPFVPPVWPIPTYFPLKTYTENLYRAVTCTKLINYHAIEDSVVVMDKGSMVSTKTIAFDAETGDPIVSQTANEFNDPIYNVSYPAYWAYSGTGLAYTNINREFAGANFDGGRITLNGISESPSAIFESGDELYIIKQSAAATCNPASAPVNKLWVFDKNKNSTALTMPVKDLVFMDAAGNPYTMGNVDFRIVRSGKRNNLGLNVSTATAMKNPIQNGVLQINNTANIVSAGAIEFKEKWQTDGDVFNRYIDIPNPSVCNTLQQIDCYGYPEKSINPYVKGLIGNYKPYRSYVYYGDRNETDFQVPTAIRKNGYIAGFGNFWGFNAANNLVPDYTNTKWVWNSQLTKVNAKGQELETMDALNRYTAAQYGFLKNMPVAMTQNARSGESFAEGFEDNSYLEKINAGITNTCDNNKYLSFNGISNLGISPQTTTVKPHSGNSMLVVSNNSTAIKPLNLSTINDAFDILPVTQYAAQSDYGFFVNGTQTGVVPGNFDNLVWNIGYTPNSDPQGSPPHNVSNEDFYINAYFNIVRSGNYLVQSTDTYSFTGSYYYAGGNDCNPPVYHDPSGSASIDLVQFQVADLNNNILFDKVSPQTYVYLNKGIYLVKKHVVCSYNVEAPINYTYASCGAAGGAITDNYGTSVFMNFNHNFLKLCPTDVISKYKTLNTTTGCSYTAPISAKTTMQNSAFALVPGKHMQFSAWIHEDCPVIPCQKIDYSLSNIEIWSNGAVVPGSTIKRTGTIIDGWQKIEGDFIVPTGATTAEIRFINSNTVAPMYVDDIRLHPYNANMKSYVYDPRTLRLSAELDENNYASFYEYDEEGQLIRVKKETIQGVKTIQETRSAKQKVITEVQ